MQTTSCTNHKRPRVEEQGSASQSSLPDGSLGKCVHVEPWLHPKAIPIPLESGNITSRPFHCLLPESVVKELRLSNLHLMVVVRHDMSGLQPPCVALLTSLFSIRTFLEMEVELVMTEDKPDDFLQDLHMVQHVVSSHATHLLLVHPHMGIPLNDLLQWLLSKLSFISSQSPREEISISTQSMMNIQFGSSRVCRTMLRHETPPFTDPYLDDNASNIHHFPTKPVGGRFIPVETPFRRGVHLIEKKVLESILHANSQEGCVWDIGYALSHILFMAKHTRYVDMLGSLSWVNRHQSTENGMWQAATINPHTIGDQKQSYVTVEYQD